MTGTQTVRRTTTRARRGGSMQLLRGLGAAMLTTIIVVAVFALLMQWVKPTEDTVRIFNQLLKVVSVAIGTYIAVGRSGRRTAARRADWAAVHGAGRGGLCAAERSGRAVDGIFG